MLAREHEAQIVIKEDSDSDQSDPAALGCPKACPETMLEWRNSARSGCQVFVQRKLALDTKAIGHANELSLVDVPTSPLVPRHVSFVSWRNVASLRGRPTYLDSRNRVVYSVAIKACAERSYEGCQIVHPAVGVSMVKTTAAGRPSVDESVIRLKRMWEATQAIDASECIDACLSCHGHADAVAGDVHTCAVCLRAWHSSCAKRLAKLASDDIAMMRIELSVAEIDSVAALSETFQHASCSLCLAWLWGK